MPAITVQQLNDAAVDVLHLSAVANSSELTATDRFGVVKRTVAGVLAEYPGSSAAAVETFIDTLIEQEVVSPANSEIVAAVYNTATYRYAPFMAASGRLLQTLADGSLSPAVGRGEQLAEKFPLFGLIEGERPYRVTTDVNGKVIEAWTLEGSYFIAAESGLVRAGSGSPIAPAYESSADTVLFGVTSTISLPTNTAICYILPTLGQSNALGQNNFNDPVIAGTAIYPSNCFMFAGTSPRRTSSPVTTLVPLVEFDSGSTSETAASGWANHLVRDVNTATGRLIRTLSFVAAVGGIPYRKLKRGTAAYKLFLQSMADSVTACRANGWIPVVPAIDWMQGESDTDQVSNMTQRWYEREMKQLARHLTEDVMRITGQKTEPILFLTQIAFAPGAEYWHQPVRAAALALDGSNNIRCAGPFYPMPPASTGSESIHANCLGQNQRGQMLARATITECFGSGWRTMTPTGFRWVSSTMLDIDVECLLPPLVIDTSGSVINMTGMDAGNGFIFDDRSGSPPAITSVAIVNNTTVRITLASAPTGLGCRVGYATKSTTAGEYGSVAGARGCLRDSAPSVNAYNGNTQYNWCNSFVLEVNHP